MSSKKAFLLVLPAVVLLGNCMYVEVDKQDFSNVQMHSACQEKDFCLEQTPDYPYELIDNLLTKVNLAYIDSSSTEHRTSDRNKSPCDAYNTNAPIYQIRDKNNKVRFVVQTKKFEQIISMEWCQNKGEIKNTSMYLPFDLNQLRNDSLVVSCEETYTNYKFLVLGLDGKSLESVMVGENSIPVCCRCNIKDVSA